jgi:hypothetical protein
MFFIPGARWLRLMRAQQLEYWRLRAAFFITPRRAIDCGCTDPFYLRRIERKTGNKPGIKTVALESYQRERKRFSGRR